MIGKSKNKEKQWKEKTSFSTYFKQHPGLYLMLVPALVYVIIFNLIPLHGLQLAFREYNLFAAETPWKSISASEWVGFKHFEKLVKRPDFWRAVRNTFQISLLKIAFIFPLPIIFALLLNEVRLKKFQRGVQLIVYLPHFLSWVVVSGIFVSLLGSTGPVNSFLAAHGHEKVKFLMDNDVFRGILVFSDAWKSVGWSSIIYFAAIAGLDYELYEAARVDGANRFQQLIYITLPGIVPTIILMFILRVGGIMDAGFGQIFVMYNPTVYESADIIGTYVYRMGLGKLDFSTGTAVGLVNSIIGMIMIVSSNVLAKRFSGKSIW